VEKTLIVGGGFRGIVAGHYLSAADHQVTLIEGAPFLGGVMRSESWNGFQLDKGCHIFGNDNVEVTDVIFAIMGDAVVPVDGYYASMTAGKVSEGITIPDLTVFGPDVCAKILYETVEAAAHESGGGANLKEVLTRRFGATAAGHLGTAVAKMLRTDPVNLDPSTLRTVNLGRARVVPDDTAGFLKNLPGLDDRIAKSSQDDPFRYAPDAKTSYRHSHFYPATMGMRGFCDAAEKYLTSAGVELCLGTRIEGLSIKGDGIVSRLSNGTEKTFDRVFWATDLGILSGLLFGANSLADLQHTVPMVLFYFVVPEGNVGPYTYLQDFTPENLVFRISTAGSYSRQIKADGTTYICCEVTTELGSPVWEDPQSHAEAIWQEALALGAVTGPRHGDFHVLKTPVSYRVGKPGYGAVLDDLAKGIAALSPRIVVDAQGAFYRTDILRDLRRILAA